MLFVILFLALIHTTSSLVNTGFKDGKNVTLSNIKLPNDLDGNKMLTGELSVMAWNGSYYFYTNVWGDCPGINCCESEKGCASCCFDDLPPNQTGCSPYLDGHYIQAYKTDDFVNWENLGQALPLAARQPGVEFRPCVIYNKKNNNFVMWYEDRNSGGNGYSVATSPTPQGPFTTIANNVGLPGHGRTADYNIFIDQDDSAYHVRTGFDIVRLDDSYTGPDVHIASFTTPKPAEGPTMFKRNSWYYITAGTGCCACIGGSNIFVFASQNVSGPYVYYGDVGSVPGHVFDAHSPDNYVTKAQGSAVITVGPEYEKLYIGNQWNSGLSETPVGNRSHDLLYFAVFEFDDEHSNSSYPPVIKQLEYQEQTTILV